MALSATMKAINLNKSAASSYHGPLKVTDLTFNPSHPVPIPDPSDVLIRIHAVAISPQELSWPAPPGSTFPRIPSHDIAGTVVSAPPSSQIKPGDRVYGLKSYFGQGGLAEYALADPLHLAKIPENLDFVQAASVPRAALTAWQAFKVQRGGVLKKGMSVLVTGASGAVGRYGVQIGKSIVGVTGKVVAVGGVGSGVLREMGADVVVNYRETPDWVTEAGKGGQVDVVFDCVGEKVLEGSLGLVRAGGVVVTIGTAPPDHFHVEGWDELKEKGGVEGLFFIVSETGEHLMKVGELIQKGTVKPSVSFVVDGLSEEGVRDGWNRALKGGMGGSVVVKVFD